MTRYALLLQHYNNIFRIPGHHSTFVQNPLMRLMKCMECTKNVKSLWDISHTMGKIPLYSKFLGKPMNTKDHFQTHLNDVHILYQVWAKSACHSLDYIRVTSHCRLWHYAKQCDKIQNTEFWQVNVVFQPLYMHVHRLIFGSYEARLKDSIVHNSYLTVNWGAWDAWSNAPQLLSDNYMYYDGSWPPFIIFLPYDDPPPSCSSQFAYKYFGC